MTELRKPFFTVAITTYNRADSYLPETLKSALAQTHDDLEILVSDNGSSDSTEQLIASFSDPRLKYYKHLKNIAPRDHFRFCIEEAKGQYVLILHDDDTIDANFVATCAKYVAGSNQYGLIQTGVRLMDVNSQFIEEKPNKLTRPNATNFMVEWTKGTSSLYYCNVMYNREHMINVGNFHSKTNYYLDLAANFRLAATYPILAIEEVIASFRVGNASLGTTEKFDARIDESKYIVDLMASLVPENSKLLRDAGNKFFSARMLRYADELPTNLLSRFHHYKMISNAFGKQFGLIHIVRRLVRKLRQG